MSSLLNSTQNTRPLLTNSFRYIRSDMPNHLSEGEVQWFLQNNVLTIIDLRTPAEVKQKACPLESRSEFNYLNIPVTGGNIVPPAPSQVANSYLNMVDNTMWKIIAVIENAKTNVLYFCNAGKDRTGVVSALLLSRMHIDRKTIIDDYMQSADNLKEMLQAYATENPMADLNVITPQASYMEDFLNRLMAVDTYSCQVHSGKAYSKNKNLEMNAKMELKFEKISLFKKGILYQQLLDSYSFDSRWSEHCESDWIEYDDFFFNNLAIADKFGFITVLDGIPIGHISWDPRNAPEYVQIGHNCIISDYKGNGYGKRQLQEAIHRIQQYDGLKKIIVDTNSNLIAPHNYESVGFKLRQIRKSEGDSSLPGDNLDYEMIL